MRRWIAVLGAFLAVACSSTSGASGDGGAAPWGFPDPDPAGDLETLWQREEDEPYPFETPIPPRTATPIDGFYQRNLVAGSVPIPCRRCAPFRLDRGLATLELAGGRYHVIQEDSNFRTEGHYVLDGNQIVLFNDPNCPHTRGTFTWTLVGGTLAFQTIDDPCAFDLLRARYFSAAPWRR